MSKINKHKQYSKRNQKLNKYLKNKSETNTIVDNLSQNILKKKKDKTISKNQKLKTRHKKWILRFQQKPILSSSFHKRLNKKKKSQLLSDTTEIFNSLPKTIKETGDKILRKSKKQVKEIQKQETMRFNTILHHLNFQRYPWESIKKHIKESFE
ncbi:hypothetical protein MERGE_000246 [Pneumocystis wakefieldiae]|uniref:Ribosome biogenesis protein SLX9 n=1 Tax=Pneumocystis wakefieldiae TaxID=38082 RepID=A0A899FQN3_9ASCO|nr:hypothetical protein MERGE_000246 [Pneumocystis wakefieldiae]